MPESDRFISCCNIFCVKLQLSDVPEINIMDNRIQSKFVRGEKVTDDRKKSQILRSGASINIHHFNQPWQITSRVCIDAYQ